MKIYKREVKGGTWYDIADFIVVDFDRKLTIAVTAKPTFEYGKKVHMRVLYRDAWYAGYGRLTVGDKAQYTVETNWLDVLIVTGISKSEVDKYVAEQVAKYEEEERIRRENEKKMNEKVKKILNERPTLSQFEDELTTARELLKLLKSGQITNEDL